MKCDWVIPMMHLDDVIVRNINQTLLLWHRAWRADRDQLSFSVHPSNPDGRDDMASQGKMKLIADPRRGQLHQKVSRIHSGSARENEIGILLWLISLRRHIHTHEMPSRQLWLKSSVEIKVTQELQLLWRSRSTCRKAYIFLKYKVDKKVKVKSNYSQSLHVNRQHRLKYGLERSMWVERSDSNFHFHIECYVKPKLHFLCVLHSWKRPKWT